MLNQNIMQFLPYVLDRLTESDPGYGAEVRAFVDSMDSLYQASAEAFFARYASFARLTGRSIDLGVTCFLELRRSMEEERLHFFRTGEYSSKSFAEVNARVYSDPVTMQYHMHGLVLAQFLWPDQYRRFSFFRDGLPSYRNRIGRYLEVGSGHGLYLLEAMRLLDPATCFDAVDISPSSMELVEGMVGHATRHDTLRFRLMDIFDLPESEPYDFITMGEVLEHVEQPRSLLRRLHHLLSPAGRAFITTPANAPTRDHIYLFNNAAEIREMFTSAGFAIESEVAYYPPGMSSEKAERLRLPLMFGAFLKRA
ncbi:MAG TPA: methyltransferase domain-containing protein [Bryobacteraceae bacterium]|nr:methyltransferase domain-containing protein [Bryobacteraceae bacterium]